MAHTVTCPFCGYHSDNEYTIQLHIEERHTADSPFVPANERPKSRIQSGSSKTSSECGMQSMPGDMWAQCTRKGCGEHVLLAELDEHLDLHTAEEISQQEDEGPPPLLPPRPHRRPPRIPMGNTVSTRVVIPSQTNASSGSGPQSPRQLEKRNLKDPKSRSKGSSSSLLSYFSGTASNSRTSTLRKLREPTTPGRLGKQELGPYAFEERMPEKVRDHLLFGAEPHTKQLIGNDGRLCQETVVDNETPGLIHVLADLCSLEETNTATYLCHPSTKHVRRLYCDGNFCGYWSTQMVLSYIQHMNPEGPQKLPNVIKMQEIIERAWSNGTGAYGRIETGGIKNTRKWIGTNEALAFFTEIGVNVEALAVKDGDGCSEKTAAEDLLDWVEAYFISGIDSSQRLGTSLITRLSPIYFQRLGHSMSIVGLEREVDGSRNLLVFDSSFATSEPMKKLLAGSRTRATLDTMLRAYRRSDTSLSRWDEFEVLVPQTSPTTL